MGAIEIGPDDEPQPATHVVLVKFGVATAAIAMVNYFLFAYAVEPTARNIGIAVAIHAIYCLLAYFVHPVADESDMGLVGPLVDDPFSKSDDINRSLYTLFMLLAPGRFIGQTIVYFVRRILNQPT